MIYLERRKFVDGEDLLVDDHDHEGGHAVEDSRQDTH